MSRGRCIARKASSRTPGARVLVITEGALTEPAYLKVFEQTYGYKLVKLVPIGGVGDPRSVVERAMQEREKLRGDSLAGRDSVWAMFDRDAHAKFDEAKNMAYGNSIPLAISNPCFELWAVFHYRDHDAPVDRHACQQMLQELCPGYARRKCKVFNDAAVIQRSYLDAVDRAARSLARREAEGVPEGNPSTTVHDLTEHILRLVERVKREK